MKPATKSDVSVMNRELVFEMPPSGCAWILAAVFSLTLLAFTMGLWNHGYTYGALGLGALALLGLYLTGYLFIRRNDHEEFYQDCVKLYRKRVLRQTLPYADALAVAYGWRNEGRDQFLSFRSADGTANVYVNFRTSLCDADNPKSLTEEKLLWLRDLLYDVVADRMLNRIGQSGEANWIRGVKLSRQGLLLGEALYPWPTISTEANDSTGAVRILSNGRKIVDCSMVGEDVVPGLFVINRFVNAEMDEASTSRDAR
jgi:hypothetical protein